MQTAKIPEPTLPIASQSNQIESFMSWLKVELSDMQYGEVGLQFTVHHGDVVRVNQIKNISCKAGTK